jgi:glycosyltransferase involved in cell wall biosynthesis
MSLVYGQERPGTVPATVPLDAAWATRIQNRYWTLGSSELCWQPCLKLLSFVDLAVVEQANRLLLNYVLQFQRQFSQQRLAFWGHGANLQAKEPASWRERLKARLSSRVDWWFAYTEMSAQLVQGNGFPRERITVVENAIDDSELKGGLDALASEQVDEASKALGVQNARVALFCGGMRSEKRLEFLVNSCLSIKRRVPDFHVLFVGSGPEEHLVKAACARHPWMHYIGPVHGARRSIYFAMSQVLLMPGLVGLAIVDSFVAEVPLFTTDIAIHSPEICYLKHGTNGIITTNAVEDYAAAVARCLSSADELSRLRDGCRESGRRYTLHNMVSNFARGIQACLSAERR